MSKKLYIETVGCQMNVLDSELVVGGLRRDGYELTHEAVDADVILFNTCSVREHAEEKIYSALGRLVGHKKSHPDKVIGVIGCMAQKDQELIRRRAPHVDMVVGTGQLGQIPSLVKVVQETRQPQYALSLGRAEAGKKDVEASFESYDPVRDPSMRPTSFQAFVRIQIGCDKFCTYCVVPSTRGPEQSRHPNQIWGEVKQLADEGCKEITLLGQTVNSYEFEHGDGRRTRLSDLIAGMHEVPGIERIKFVTNYPKDMTDDLLDAVRELPKAVKYLHVPVQSGCNEVLKRMKRMYSVEFYREMLQRCREKVPGVAISSDFIVGFCGETEEAFQKTCDLVRESRFKNSFIFKYSKRPGTKADDLYPDDIPEEVKKRRNNDLLAIQNANSLADHKSKVGETVSVLVEGPSKLGMKQTSGPIQLAGRSMTDHIVVFDGNPRLIGQTIDVRVHEASPFTLYGQAVTTDLQKTETWSEPVSYPKDPANDRRLGLPLV
ncbi:tRNA (N6-isopentenyl adenosine(37)-C2)-methylthiotransferase MiaB [Telmatocola sphagniphila]|uniref:tRNA-2-methylthio-N(6)-dimethylallyladenosine synthase n=1 Tax=Telmatocola sphagniphila TaxID=1123043 RepID=A0A8E6BAZ2_9BACT|nr:tRNA (N6-isopentenyl adenosine(37)-C2)-methylthiotransferase MiaB [Telmatocola sphagniphila]